MPINRRQEAFIAAFLGEAHFNATKAARLAGYKAAGVQASRMLTNDNISAEIERRLREKCLPPEEILARLSDQARGIGEFVRVTEGGRLFVDLKGLKKAGKAHLIHKVSETKSGQSVEFYDAQAALVHIGRHYKLFTDKLETQQTVHLLYDDLSDEELEERIRSLEGAAAPEGGAAAKNGAHAP